MSFARKIGIGLLSLGLLVAGNLLYSYQNSKGIDEHKPEQVVYELRWDTEDTEMSEDMLFLKTNLGYELELTEARLQLDSFEMVACEHDHATLRELVLPKAAAGHGDGPLNPTKIDTILPLDLLQPDNQVFAATVDEPEYCLFHQVFGMPQAGNEQSVLIKGRYREPSGSWQPLDVASSIAYGENTQVLFKKTHATSVAVVYEAATVFDDIAFGEGLEDKDIARQALENMIGNARVIDGIL